MSVSRIKVQNSAATIFARVWESATGSMSVPVARHVLKLGFSKEDKARVHELLERNREGRLSAAELAELDDFVKIGDLLALLQSKARRLIKQVPTRRAKHG